jgi:hypothetical protein
MICSSCYEECNAGARDNGFFYDYGSITNAWHSEIVEGSDCCGEVVLEGEIYLRRTTEHVARKEHGRWGRGGSIMLGDRYQRTIIKGYCIEDGVRRGIMVISKRRLR